MLTRIVITEGRGLSEEEEEEEDLRIMRNKSNICMVTKRSLLTVEFTNMSNLEKKPKKVQ